MRTTFTDTDKVDLGNGLVINSQSIGVADKNKTTGFSSDIDGILGIGPADLSAGETLCPPVIIGSQ